MSSSRAVYPLLSGSEGVYIHISDNRGVVKSAVQSMKRTSRPGEHRTMVNAYTEKDEKEEREVEEMLEPPCSLPVDGPCHPTMHRAVVDYVMDEEHRVHGMLCEKTNLLSDEITFVGDMETSESNLIEDNVCARYFCELRKN